MPYRPDIVDPPVGSSAFAERSEAAQLSQAAFILLLAKRLAERRGNSGHPAGNGWQNPDEQAFGVPFIPWSGRRYPLDGSVAQPKTDGRLAEEPTANLARLVANLQNAPSDRTAVELLRACIGSRFSIVRSAAAAAMLELTSEPSFCLDVLAKSVVDDDPLVRDVAATVLARVMPEHDALRNLAHRGGSPRINRPAMTSLLVHGTWARTDTWWQPGGDFHLYLLAGSLPDMYAGSDRPDWSGGYSDAARLLGAAQLKDWLIAHNETDSLLIGHSHGANVVMLAGQMGSTSREIVLLSCPVRWPDYSPDFRICGRAVSIRVRMDLVILADGGGQRFYDSRIEENVLPVWFHHAATHDPAIWKKHDVDRMIQ